MAETETKEWFGKFMLIALIITLILMAIIFIKGL